jgi:hypothetical protein
MPPTTGLATLLTQLYQHAQIMDNILKATYFPTDITDAGQAQCREYLGRASDHMIKMGDAYRSISAQHPLNLDTHEVRAASARQYHLLVRFMELTTTLEERTQARPKHSNTQQGLLNTQAGTNAIVTVSNQIVNTLATNLVGDISTLPTSEEFTPQPIQPTNSQSNLSCDMASTPCTPQGEATNQMIATISTSSQLTNQVRMKGLNTFPTNLQHNLLTTSPMKTAVEAEATLSLPTNQRVSTISSTSPMVWASMGTDLATNQIDTVPSFVSAPCTPQGKDDQM